MKVYVNGKLVRENRAMVSIFDRGFLYGDGAFETMRSYNSKIFRLEEHIRRLFFTLKELKINHTFKPSELPQLLNFVLKENRLKDAYIRLGATRGESEGGFEIVKEMPPTLYIIAKHLKPYPESFYQRGVKVTIVSTRKTPSSSVESKLKTHNFLQNILARIGARERKAFEGIMLDIKGNICEGAVSNIFFVKDGVLLTPSAQCDILLGITRQTVIELAKKLKIAVREGRFKVRDLLNCEECFLTNSLIEILPVKAIDASIVDNGKPGKITKTLIKAYKGLVKEN